MLELPESLTIARQLCETVRGKQICSVIANQTPHKFAFYSGDPASYDALLRGRILGDSTGIGALVEIDAGDRSIVLGDGVSLRYLQDIGNAPHHHQLLIEFADGSALVCTIQMYGMLWAFPKGSGDNPHYLTSRNALPPLTAVFDFPHFDTLRTEHTRRLSAKAFLATEQRIPGLGNGVLQDILFNARIHPKRRIETLSESEFEGLYHAVKATLADMADAGGRNTEKDLFGHPGGYETILSRNTAGSPCPVCGEEIQKSAYLGGSVYWCPHCQPSL